MIPFVKMHGCGNDFIVVRGADLAAVRLPFGPDELARRACDRHYGIGADGLLVHEPLEGDAPRVRMRTWNADGSRAEMCGNGARCVVRDACERDAIASPLVLVTDAGEHRAVCTRDRDRVSRVALSMGRPRWDAASIPARFPVSGSAGDAGLDLPLQVPGETLSVSAVGMGNPHAIVFVADRAALARIRLSTTGRALAEHAAFPSGANASFVAVEGGDLHLRVWERGVGPTLACGTASCAALAVAVRTGRIGARRAVVHLPGGAVEVWQEEDDTLWLAGPAVVIGAGTLSAELLDGGSI